MTRYLNAIHFPHFVVPNKSSMFSMRMNRFIFALFATATLPLSHAKEGDVLFQEDFNRKDADSVGNEWLSRGTVNLKGNAMHFGIKEAEFRPRSRHTFPATDDGKVKVSFKWDWLRSAEGTWSFHIQLGNGSKMPKSLAYKEDLAKGVGVNLIWGGGDPVASATKGLFGYIQDGNFTSLFVANDTQAKDTVPKDTTLTIEADTVAGTFSLNYNGQDYKDLPFDNPGPIDTIRFVANGCSTSGFSKSSIDDLVVIEGKKSLVAKTAPKTYEPKDAAAHVQTKEPTNLEPIVLVGQDTKTYETLVLPLMERYCIDCHGEDIQKARLRLDELDGFKPSDRHLWTKVHQQLTDGKMPPKKKRHPEPAEKQKLLAWIEKEQRALSAGSTRRLNRREFSSALQDVTGLDVDFAYTLPGDSKVDGFDTGGEALQDASDSVNQMMEVARRAVEGIRFLEPAQSKILNLDLVNVAKDPNKKFDAWKAEGITIEKVPRIAKPGLGALVEPSWPRDPSSTMFRVPAPENRQGIMRVKFSVSSYTTFPGIPDPFLWIKIGGRVLDKREITGPTDLEYQVQFEDSLMTSKGLRVDVTPRVELAYGVKGFENEDRSKPSQLPNGAGLFRPVWDKRKLREPDQQPRPFLVLKNVELEPHYIAAWPPAKWGVDLGKPGDNPQYAGKLLALWMERAYRRPVTKQEQQNFFSFYKQLRGQGMTFDNALRSTFQSVLMSSPFRYLDSTAHEDKPVADHAVASRLSFMLVGAPPDAELLELAASGKLRRPVVLTAQAQRLLNDPRNYQNFLRPFVTQWLEMEQPITLADTRRGKASYHFRRHLGDSMREETYRYIHRMLEDNRPAQELVASNWTMMNDTLARHYGYPALEGAHLRKVSLRRDDPRGGGIMSHSGIQSMLCWMGDNWVIYRGAWAAKHILDDPPQLPPLEVPELDPTAGDNKYMTARELMKLHREDKNCYVCHIKLDPIGFAFQNFDISGRWRNVEHQFYEMDELDSNVAWRGTGKTRPVDTVGELPGGEKYTSYDEFKKVVAQSYQDDMVRGIMKKFLLFATGRKPDIDDMAEIKTIMQEHEKKGYPLRDMLLAVFQTDAFLAH